LVIITFNFFWLYHDGQSLLEEEWQEGYGELTNETHKALGRCLEIFTLGIWEEGGIYISSIRLMIIKWSITIAA